MTKLELAENLNVEVNAKDKVKYLMNKFNKKELEILTELYNNSKGKREIETEYNVITYSEVIEMAIDCLGWNDYIEMLQMDDIYLTDKQYQDLYIEELLNAFQDDGYTIIDDRNIIEIIEDVEENIEEEDEMIGKLTVEQSEELSKVGLDYLRERLEEVGNINIDFLTNEELEKLLDLDFMNICEFNKYLIVTQEG